jgi:phospholipase D1/2
MTSRNLLKLVLACLVAGAIAALWFSPLRAQMTRENVIGAVAHLRGLWYAPLVLILLYAVGCIFAIPASFFILAAGAIWGWKLGGTYAMIGGVLGATLSFLVARFIGEGLLEKFGSMGQKVKKQVAHAGFKSLLILRLIPVFPFAVLNYGSGVAGVRLRDFVLATTLGLITSNYVFAYSADALLQGNMTEGEAIKRLAVVGLLLISVIMVPTLIKRRMSQAVVESDAE